MLNEFIKGVDTAVSWFSDHKYEIGVYVVLVLLLVTSDRLMKSSSSGSDHEFAKIMVGVSAALFGITTITIAYSGLKHYAASKDDKREVVSRDRRIVEETEGESRMM